MNRLEGRLPERHLFEIQRKIASRDFRELAYSTEAVAGVDQAFDDIRYLDLETRGYSVGLRRRTPQPLVFIKNSSKNQVKSSVPFLMNSIYP